MSQLLPFLVLGLALLWWWDSMRAREAAVGACRRACRAFGAQFLDDSVVLRRLRVQRDSGGGLCLARLYHFEFSQTGDGRQAGYARLLGRRVVDVHLDAAEHPPASPVPGLGDSRDP